MKALKQDKMTVNVKQQTQTSNCDSGLNNRCGNGIANDIANDTDSAAGNKRNSFDGYLSCISNKLNLSALVFLK